MLKDCVLLICDMHYLLAFALLLLLLSASTIFAAPPSKFAEISDQMRRNEINRLPVVRHGTTKIGGPIPDWSDAKLDGKVRYLQAIFMVDAQVADYYNNSLGRIKTGVMSLLHKVNLFLYQLDLRITVVDISVYNKMNVRLDSFLAYHNSIVDRLPEHDFAFILSYHLNEGWAYINGVCRNDRVGQCGFFPNGTDPTEYAPLLFHEMAHLLGLDHHETTTCRCSHQRSEPCLQIGGFDYECSVQALVNKLKLTYNSPCIQELPKSLAITTVPMCGNGIKEAGEECDCGPEKYCNKWNICNAATCRLSSAPSPGTHPVTSPAPSPRTYPATSPAPSPRTYPATSPAPSPRTYPATSPATSPVSGEEKNSNFLQYLILILAIMAGIGTGSYLVYNNFILPNKKPQTNQRRTGRIFPSTATTIPSQIKVEPVKTAPATAFNRVAPIHPVPARPSIAVTHNSASVHGAQSKISTSKNIAVKKAAPDCPALHNTNRIMELTVPKTSFLSKPTLPLTETAREIVAGKAILPKDKHKSSAQTQPKSCVVLDKNSAAFSMKPKPKVTIRPNLPSAALKPKLPEKAPVGFVPSRLKSSVVKSKQVPAEKPLEEHEAGKWINDVPTEMEKEPPRAPISNLVKLFETSKR